MEHGEAVSSHERETESVVEGSVSDDQERRFGAQGTLSPPLAENQYAGPNALTYMVGREVKHPDAAIILAVQNVDTPKGDDEFGVVLGVRYLDVKHSECECSEMESLLHVKGGSLVRGEAKVKLMGPDPLLRHPRGKQSRGPALI